MKMRRNYQSRTNVKFVTVDTTQIGEQFFYFQNFSSRQIEDSCGQAIQLHLFIIWIIFSVEVLT